VGLQGGALIHTANSDVLVERLQTAGPGVNIPTEQIFELGDYRSLATLRDTPEITFNMDSLDVSTDFEALLTDTDPDSDVFELANVRSVNIVTQIKPGKKQDDPFTVAKSVEIPYLMPESISYKFGLRDNATQTVSMRGDSIFYSPGAGYVEASAGTGLAGQVIVTANPAYAGPDELDNRRVLAVIANDVRLTYGPDWTSTDGAPNLAGAAVVTITLAAAVAVTKTIYVVYASSVDREFPQAVHTPALLKPAAVRGKDIDIYIGGYDPDDVPGSVVNKWTGVQSVNLDWSVTLTADEEMGNYYAVSRDFNTPKVSGSVEILPRHAADLFTKLRQMTGATEVNQAIGAASAVPLPLDVVLKDGLNGGITLKRFHCPDARLLLPGYAPQSETNVTLTIPFESDTGVLDIYRDLSAPIVKSVDPVEEEVGGCHYLRHQLRRRHGRHLRGGPCQ